MTSEEIAKKNLDETSFRRWRMLMDKIDKHELARRALADQMNLLNKRSNELYEEMRKLWEFTK